MPGLIQLPIAELLLPSSHHQPAETSPTMPQNPEEIIYRSYMWEGAVERIKWVMDALGPIPEVRVMPFLTYLAELTCTLSFSHSQRWLTAYI